jgi:hypothetical protein
VLPAHEYRFRRVAARTAELRVHHGVRLMEILDVLSCGNAAWQIMIRIT